MYANILVQWLRGSEAVVPVGINQRVSLKKYIDDVKRWVDEGRSDEWIASALGTSSSSVQSFRSRNRIYRNDLATALADPADYEVYEGVLEPDSGPGGCPGAWFDPVIEDDPRWQGCWSQIARVQMHLSPTRIILVACNPAGKTGRSRPGV